jgi:hypothetical protein
MYKKAVAYTYIYIYMSPKVWFISREGVYSKKPKLHNKQNIKEEPVSALLIIATSIHSF